MTQETCTREEILGELDRVLSSSGFVRNERMSRFLRFLVERTLDGKSSELKESIIGIEVFGRRTEFDPKMDSIVRTEAGRLRTRLHEYYTGDGHHDAVAIDVPKGAYVPIFQRRGGLPRAGRAPGRRWLATAGVAVVLTLAATGAWMLRRGHAPMRIAVLPLVSLGPKSAGDYFAPALTDEIIRNLSVIDGIEVRSSTSSFAFTGRPRDVHDAARQLQVDYLLEGSVLRDGDQLRVDAQLIRARDDVPLWSQRFDKQMTDIFAIQDEISLGIVNSLRLHLGRGRRRYETSVDAYDVYLRATVLSIPGFQQTGRPTEEPAQQFQQSIDAYERAIALDKSFAPAYAGLAYVYALRSVQFPLVHADDELGKMRDAADKALQLDPLLPETHHALAMASARDGKWAFAEASFRRSIELDPNHASTHADYAYWLLAVLGRYEDALTQLRAARQADPLSNDVLFTTALVSAQAQRYDDASRLCARLPSPAQCLVRVRLSQERFGEAIALLEANPDLIRNPQNRGFLGLAYARTGRRADAEKLLATATVPNEQALIFAGLGDRDRTYDALKRMAVLGPQRVGLYLSFPDFAFLHGDERLRVFRESVGLP